MGQRSELCRDADALSDQGTMDACMEALVKYKQALMVPQGPDDPSTPLVYFMMGGFYERIATGIDNIEMQACYVEACTAYQKAMEDPSDPVFPEASEALTRVQALLSQLPPQQDSQDTPLFPPGMETTKN